jgi:hypothetical protein
MKERVVSAKYDPVIWLGSKIGFRKSIEEDNGPIEATPPVTEEMREEGLYGYHPTVAK